MKSFKRLFTFFSLVFLFTGVLVGCQQSSEELTKIKVAEVTHSVFYAPHYVAISEGFFEEEGLEIELINAGGADKAMAALISGEVQVGFMGPEATIYVYNEGGKDQPINFAQVTQRGLSPSMVPLSRGFYSSNVLRYRGPTTPHMP